MATPHRIRTTATSGWSPNSPATHAAQPRLPSRANDSATALRTSTAAGDSDDCTHETKSASARATANTSGISHLPGTLTLQPPYEDGGPATSGPHPGAPPTKRP